MIDALRAKHDPHYKLSGKVEGLEKGVSDQGSQIHKTISKSFVTQRKTLTRVLGLEKRVNHLEIQEAAEEQAKENLDEILSDIYGEDEVGGTKTKVKPKTKKKPKAKKSKISASAFKKGTSQESLEERVERIAQNKVDEAAAEKHRQTAEYQEMSTGVDPETGEVLSPEERKRRFKLKKGTISTSKFFDKDEQKALPAGEKGGAIIKIGNSVESIVETLKEDQKQDKKHQNWIQKISERFKRRKKENKLEFRVFDGIKKTATKLLAPMKNAWSEFLGFIGKVILGRVLFKILEWMGDKDNQGKLKSIIKFFEDWWPAMLAGYLLFGNSLTSMVTGMLITMGKWLAPMLLAIGKLMLNPWVLAGLGLGAGIYAIAKTIGKEKEGENKAESTNESTDVFVDEGMDEVDVEATGDEVGDQEVQKMNKGGTVPGRGNTDTVPAMLTPGEFVMSKGAVQKYGLNTMESMNAAAGGTNKPTLMRQYEEGGEATSMSTEDLVAAAGPSLQMFMEQNNAAIDSDPDAIYGEHMRMELDRDGKMINFGKTIANMSEWAFNTGVEQLQNNEAIDPDVKEALLKKMMFIRRGTLENPNFKADLAFDINKDIPGTAAHRLFLRAQADTTSPAAMAGISARDRALLMNRRKMSGGGLVQGFQGGGGVGSIKFTGEQLRNTLSGSPKNVANITPRKSATVITPSEKKKNVIVAYEEEKQKMVNDSNTKQSSQEIPQFDVTLGRSAPKIKLLGISV